PYSSPSPSTPSSSSADTSQMSVPIPRSLLVPADVLNHTFVNNLYLALLHRQADANGLAYYSGRLDKGDPRAQIVAEVLGSEEYHTDVVQQLYRTYLHRAADDSGLKTYVPYLDSGGTVAQLRAILLSSDEYYTGRGHGTDAGYLAALYQDVLGRPVDASGLATYLHMLGGGSRVRVAWALLTGSENSQARVERMFQWLLRRSADTDGLNAYSAVLMHGGSEASIIAILAGSGEFYNQLDRQRADAPDVLEPPVAAPVTPPRT